MKKPTKTKKKPVKRKPITIQIYPPCPKPKWIFVGARVEVLGEGSGKAFRIVAVEGNRAAVVPAGQYRKNHPGGCWESFMKIYRAGRFDEDYAETHEQLELPITKVTKSK